MNPADQNMSLHIYVTLNTRTPARIRTLYRLKVCRSPLQVTKASAAAVAGRAILVPDDYQVSVRPQLGVVYLALVCSVQSALIE